MGATGQRKVNRNLMTKDNNSEWRSYVSEFIDFYKRSSFDCGAADSNADVPCDR